MNKARRLLMDTAMRWDLPADALAGVPRMELTGFQEFSVEPHRGLLEYEKDRIGIETSLGKVWLLGRGLSIKVMNRETITIRGELCALHLGEPV